ncbi:MAG: ABC transporter substrate-binding protein [Proteobacteria bacterium]|nr:ABC transporter substrate-binding protein [Pseudomonadota bacterium]
MSHSPSHDSTATFYVTRRMALAAVVGTLFGGITRASAGEVTDAAGQAVSAKAPRRIVTIGSAATEIVVALGAGDRVVGIDTTSKGIPGTENLPDIGYMRALAAEGILAQTPDLIIATMDSGPREVIEALRQSGIPLAQLPIAPTIESIREKIALIGTLLDLPDAADTLSKDIGNKAQELAARIAQVKHRPKALFILGMANGRITVGGHGTAADAVLALAGAENIARDVEGYKPFSPEMVVAEPPEAIILMSAGGHGADTSRIKSNDVLSATPAVKADAVFAVDGSALLSFGPRTLDAAAELAQRLHGSI